MDFFSELAKDLVRAQRGAKSQNWLSQRMAFNFNVVTRWESGTREVRLSEFFRVCDVMKVNLNAPNSIITGNKNTHRDKVFGVLCSQLSAGAGCQLLGCSKSSFYRMCKGAADPKLKDFLKVIEHLGNLSRWLKSLVNEPEHLPSVREELKKSNQARKLFANNPMASPILLYLDTGEYSSLKRHCHIAIAERFAMLPEKVEKILHQLERVGLVYWIDNKLKASTDFVNLGWSHPDDLKDLNRIEKFWVQSAVSAFAEDSNFEREVIGFQVFHASEESIQKIRTCANEFYGKVHRILEEDSERTGAMAVLNYQLLRF